MRCVTDDHENGKIYEGDGYMVFEDTQEAVPRFYGWLGTWDDHDTAVKKNECYDFDSLEEASEKLAAMVSG